MIAKMIRRIVLVLAIAALPAQAGTVSLAFNQHAAQNLFQTRDAVADQVSAFSLAVDQDLAALSILARIDYSAFRETTGLSSFGADLGADYLLAAGPKSAFYFAAGGDGRFYGRSYEAFSSLGGHLLAAFKTYLAPSSILKLQWQGRTEVFRDSLFDYWSQVASLSIDKYFPSRTTLKADAEWGYKYFLHPFLPEAAAEPVATALPSGPGTGGGWPSGTGSEVEESGWGGRHYQGGEGFVPRTSSTGGGAGLGHVTVSFLAAQGLGDIVGLSASATRQWIVSGENPFLSVEEFYLVQNPSADSFSWDGHQLTGRLTVNLPWDLSAKGGYAFSDKTFPGVESLGPDGLPLGLVRNDRRHLVEARLQKDFRRLSAFVAYAYIRNSSTDPLFAWRSHFVTAGLEWNLPTGRKGGL